MWLYRTGRDKCFEVGYYTPTGEFFCDSIHPTVYHATLRVRYLNGASNLSDYDSINGRCIVAKIFVYPGDDCFFDCSAEDAEYVCPCYTREDIEKNRRWWENAK